jgi:hypothetical protein
VIGNVTAGHLVGATERREPRPEFYECVQPNNQARNRVMSNWSFREIGSFKNEAEVDEWARRNQVNPGDLKTRKGRFRPCSVSLMM